MQHGHYTVGDTVYVNKLDALLASTRSGQQVHWHWHDAYNHIDWTARPEISLQEIYRRRAQQLREKYDKVILSFSGGSDSWTVLHSFLSNRIRIDEIFVRWPIKATQNLFVANDQDHRPENILSEWELAIKPVLNNLQKTHPEIKITVYDWSDQLIHAELDDDFLKETQDHLNPGFSLKYNAMGDSELKSIDRGQKTCIVFGIDKPQICVRDHRVYCYFLDSLANCRAQPRPGRSVELFYWTADLPDLTYIQARIIYDYLCQHPELADLVQLGSSRTPEQKYIWDNIVRSLVYPNYDTRTFQARKAGSTIYAETDSWFSLLPDQRFLHSWNNVFDNLVNSIDNKFFNFKNGQHNSLAGFISPLYYLGDLPETQRLT